MSVTDPTPTLVNSPPSFLGKVLRLPLRMIPRSAQVPVLYGALRGKRWIIESSVHRCWLGTYEYSLQKLFLSTIKRGDVFYDLGAHVGFYSLLASSLIGPEGHVFSFEPVPENLAFLRSHLELNGVENCSVIDAAVSSSAGTARFDRGGDDPHRRIGHLVTDSPDSFDVRTISLDELIASGQIDPPNVIKCDIEGAEFDALRGAAGTLSKYRPIIVLATHGPAVHKSCCTMLTDLQYQLTPLDGVPLSESWEILASPHSARPS
jgi:FkbM family methyltransferase